MIQKCTTGFAAVLLCSAALLDTASAGSTSVNVASAGTVQRFDHSQIKETETSATNDMTY